MTQSRRDDFKMQKLVSVSSEYDLDRYWKQKYEKTAEYLHDWLLLHGVMLRSKSTYFVSCFTENAFSSTSHYVIWGSCSFCPGLSQGLPSTFLNGSYLDFGFSSDHDGRRCVYCALSTCNIMEHTLRRTRVWHISTYSVNHDSGTTSV